MSDEEEFEPKTVFCPECEGRGTLPVYTPGGFNINYWTECDECSAGEITIEDEETEQWFIEQCKKYGLMLPN